MKPLSPFNGIFLFIVGRLLELDRPQAGLDAGGERQVAAADALVELRDEPRASSLPASPWRQLSVYPVPLDRAEQLVAPWSDND
jgi:hypothetical protein